MFLPPLPDLGNRSEEERALYANLSQCVRCAICLPTCPTFQETLDEGHSPRGRIALVRALYENEGSLSSGLGHYLGGCLECRACETACPNNVVFHRIIEYGKEQLGDRFVPRAGKFFKWFFLRRIFRNARSLDRLMLFLRFYRRSGLRALARGTRILKLLPWHLGDLERLMPPGQAAHRPARKKRDYTLIPAGTVRGTVEFFTGCIADHWLQSANHATIRLLLRAGFAVRVPSAQQCCGALHVHLGEAEQGKELARRNIAAFSAAGDGLPVITNAAGCGAALKEYGYLLRRETDEAAGITLAGRVRDLSQFLCSVAPHLPEPRPLNKRVTWDDPCHLIHGQKVETEPRRLIRAIPGISFVELKEASWCCGSAGVYNIVNYGMSMQLLARKLEHVRASGAEILVTANPGCYLQLAAGARHAGIPVEVVHLAELLDRQYDGDPALAQDSDAPPWR
jgi:glycolate oxidase iron-sulfur subunit